MVPVSGHGGSPRPGTSPEVVWATMRRRLLGAVTATALLSTFPLTATAEQPDAATLTVTTTPPQTALSGRPAAPLTDGCPWATTPVEPVDASETPTDGRPVPPPLPVAARPAGGPAMAECGVTAAPGFLVPEEPTATAWIVFDLDDGDVIAAKDPHGRYRPASIIKALLALVTLEHLPLDREVVATRDSADMEGSRVGLVEDGRYTVEQLLQGLLMASGNDAGHALAQELGGDQRTLELVNAKARELGTQDTRVADYTGLTADETREIAGLTQKAMRVLRRVSNPAGFNLGMNQGAVAGAGIAAHLHQHVVPRWAGDMNFLPVIAQTRALPQLLGDARQQLADAWNS